VQLAAFWLEALWMALSPPEARCLGQPSQKERRNLGSKPDPRVGFDRLETTVMSRLHIPQKVSSHSRRLFRSCLYDPGGPSRKAALPAAVPRMRTPSTNNLPLHTIGLGEHVLSQLPLHLSLSRAWPFPFRRSLLGQSNSFHARAFPRAAAVEGRCRLTTRYIMVLARFPPVRKILHCCKI
jgi:hypothetical protein